MATTKSVLRSLGHLFLLHDTVYVTRAECYSAVIKELQSEDRSLAQQRVDFILCNADDQSDYLSTEEKSFGKSSITDLEKGRTLQRHMLKLWSLLEAITCQSVERKLNVYGTRIIDNGKLIAYRKASMTVPATDGFYAAAAKILLLLITLKREVTLNFMKLTTMLEIRERLAVETLDVADEDDILFKDDSRLFDSADVAIDNADEKKNDDRNEEYIHEESKKSQHPCEVVTSYDWEKILIDDRNEEPNVHKSAKRRRTHK